MISVFTGCNSDIVTTNHLRELKDKCIYITPIQSDNPYVGKVLRDVIEKEFIRRKIKLCESDTATILITGATFMTFRSAPDADALNSNRSAAANQAVESVSIMAKNRNGQVLLTASYDNKEQYTVSKLAQEFGAAVADKLR
jgi:ethanolamine utilization protein EutA (predicted chaperonin)